MPVFVYIYIYIYWLRSRARARKCRGLSRHGAGKARASGVTADAEATPWRVRKLEGGVGFARARV